MSTSRPRGGRLTAGHWGGILAALAAGIGVGLLGTSLHGHAWFSNGAVVPYGAALALLFVAAVSIFAAMWSRKSWNAVWCGAAAYATAGLLSVQLGSFGLILDNLQGRVWLYGIAVVAPLTGWLAWIILRGQRRRD